ncbi:ROK family protein [Brachybacterium fresconis]|uniref:NBD/HSP70 family sugar kinase n=1 Tax=Brachybacterium fresconis TaxID=173363 RepID=A0ABS4YM51_9MICO|nr:ROK family protein [Brachybacterium fresconis]MBP2409580.1 putative NBD/HSP70 family sugar kinase [Brachybacterium fresconis]
MMTADDAASAARPDSGPGTAVRQGNARDCVLTLRGASGALTIGELSAATGLSRPTVESVLQDLIAAGPIAPVPAADVAGRRGRPARRFALDPDAATVAALDLGERTVSCLITDALGAVLSRSTVAVESGDHLAAIGRAIGRTGSRPDVVGLAVPGILAADGRLTRSLAMDDLVGRDLAAEVSGLLDCSVVVENDIKLAALAERHLGPPANSIAYVQIGHRLSVALIVDGAILQGSHRLAGELGSQRGMRWTSTSRRGRLTWSTGDEAKPLLERAAAGEEIARREIEQFCAEIAPRLATVALTVDPELVVVGGGLSRQGETLLDPLRRSLHHLLMTPERPEVVAARLTTDGSLIGALGRAFEHGSARIAGVPGVPAPWPQFLAPIPSDGATTTTPNPSEARPAP